MKVKFLQSYVPTLTYSDILDRFQNHAKKLIAKRLDCMLEIESQISDFIDSADATSFETVKIPDAKRRRVKERAEAVSNAMLQRAGLSGKSKDEIEKFMKLPKSLPAVVVPTEHRADEIAAELHEEMPWMQEATTAVWHALRLSAADGLPFRIPPMILGGPPGIGKTHFARLIGHKVGVASDILDAGTENAGFGLSGLQKGWSNTNVGRLMELMLRGQTINPIFFIDEIDKSGSPSSSSGVTYKLENVLLPMLEASTNKDWLCPYHRLRFDISNVSWIFAANKLSMIDAPIKSRCRIIEIGRPTPRQLGDFAWKMAEKRGLEEESKHVLKRLFATSGLPEIAMTPRHVLRFVDRMQELERTEPLH